jgi:hypothetical protein
MKLYEKNLGLKGRWVIQGATHQNFYNFAGNTYKQRVSIFLKSIYDMAS